MIKEININGKPKKTFNEYWNKYSTIIILLLMIFVFGILEPQSFFTRCNLIKITEQSSVNVLLACGEFFGIIIGGIDLSISSTMALSGVLVARLMVAGINPVIAVIIGVFIFGALVGLINGTLINVTGLPPFIITLGTQAILRGFTYILSGARAISDLPEGFKTFVGGKLGGFISTAIVISLVVSGILIFFTTKTKAGRNIYAVGGNSISAWFAGITVKKHTLICFMISGVCASLAGMINIARLGAAEPNAGTGYETYAIAAVIIGGTSFFGGQGSILKVVIGGLIIGVINNGLNMIGVSSYYQQISMGSLIILAVTLDRFFGASSKVKK